MAERPRQAAHLSPSAIAVHYYGYRLRKFHRVTAYFLPRFIKTLFKLLP